jgi:hypothetical protein
MRTDTALLAVAVALVLIGALLVALHLVAYLAGG